MGTFRTYITLYSQCERIQLDRLHLDRDLLYRDRVFGTFAFARNTIHLTCKSNRAKYPNTHFQFLSEGLSLDILKYLSISKSVIIIIHSSM